MMRAEHTIADVLDRLNQIQARMDVVETRLSERFDKMDGRIDSVADLIGREASHTRERFAATDARLAEIVTLMTQGFANVDARLGRVEERIDALADAADGRPPMRRLS